MKTTLILVGKTNGKLFNEGIDDYAKRIGHYTPFAVKVLPELKSTKSLSESQQSDKEVEDDSQDHLPSDFVVLLDEHGTEYRKMEFAKWVEKRRNSGRDLVFVIGGPYGFSPDVYNRADALISLSRMTFSHQMVRLIFVEQLYRACTIIKGEPYHHE